MTYRPSSNSPKAKRLSVLFAVGAIALFAASAFVSSYEIVYQITAIVFAVIFVELYYKYVASDYVYQLEGGCLKVHRVTGKKTVCVCSLDLEESITQVIKSDEYLKDKKAYPKANYNVNFAKNLAPKEYYVYFFNFNEKKSMMKFEPDKIFADAVNSVISQIKADEQVEE